MKEVFYIPTDGMGEETAAPKSVKLKPEGGADLRELDEELADTFEAFGVPSQIPGKRVYPKEGERFLRALVDNSGQAYYFRSQR